MARVELSRRALDDLGGLGTERRALERALSALGREPLPANLDIKALRDRRPWHRLRVGRYRMIFRALTAAELRDIDAREERGWVVVRIVHRRDLEKAVRGL